MDRGSTALKDPPRRTWYAHRNHAHRLIRVDLSAIDNSIAEALIKTYGGLSRRAALNWYTSLRHIFNQDFDLEDLIAVGDIALCEAWITYRDGDATNDYTADDSVFSGGFAAHARRVVGWRVRDYALGVQRGPDGTTRCDSHNGGLAYEFDENPGPEERFYNNELRLWLRRAMAGLSIRQRAIMAAIAQGESQAEVARTLGLDRRDVHREFHRSLRLIRQFAEREGIVIDVGAK